MTDTTNPANPLREIRDALTYFYRNLDDPDSDEDELFAAALSRLAEIEAGGEAVAYLYRDMWNTLKLAQTAPPPHGAFPVYTHPAASPSQGWMPIETAPKDGQWLASDGELLGVGVWVAGANHDGFYCAWAFWSWNPDAETNTDDGPKFFYPNRWMPLPASPAKEPI